MLQIWICCNLIENVVWLAHFGFLNLPKHVQEEDKADSDASRAAEHQRKKLIADEEKDRTKKEAAEKRNAEIQVCTITS